MTVATCPECKDEVSVPAGVSTETHVKCPLCGVEFSMARIAKQLPPSLIVLSGSKESGSRTAGGFPIQINQGSKPVDNPVDAAPASSFSFEEKSAPAGPKPTYAADSGIGETKAARSTARSTARATARPSGGGKKQKNMVFEILKVIVGGLAAFPVVQLAVWWIGRSDPLDLGPKIGAVVPIVVPQHLRNPQVEDNAVSDDSFADDRKTRDDRKAFENINERPASQGVMKGPFNSSGTDPGKKGLASNPDIDQSVASVSNSRPKLSAEELISEKEAGNRSLKSAVSSGKGSTVEEVNAAITELLNVPPIVEGQANAENQDRHFTALCSLAEKLATLQGDTAEVESAKSTAETIISQDFPRPLQASSLRAKQLWDEAPENNTGIAICGKLVKAEPRDKYYQLEVKWAHQPSESIKIYSKDAGVLKLAADSDIVALGTVVDGPSNQLPEGQFILAVLAVPVN